jgi:flagellar biosynthetic protein FliR
MNVPLPLILGFAMVLLRTSALVVTAPILSSRTLPPRIKLALAFTLGLTAWFGAGTPQVAVPNHFGGLAGLVISETLLGMVSGLSSRLLFDAAQAGGQAAANSLGFGYGQLVNPNSGADSSVMGELVAALALGAALSLNVHREAIVWLCLSVREVPPGGTVDLMSLCGALIRQVIYAVTLAVRVGYPLFAAALFGYGALGVINRAAPQLSLTNIGFAVSIAAGGLTLYVVAPEGARMCAQAALQVFSRG